MEYIYVNKQDKTPINQQIINAIHQAISNGVLRHGDQLPTERQMCQTLSISHVAVNMAYNKLVEEKTITRIKGSGTFVNQPFKFTCSIDDAYIFDQALMFDNKDLQRVVVLREVRKRPSILHIFRNEAKDVNFLFLLRLIKYKGQVICIQRIYIPHLGEENKQHIDLYQHHAAQLLIASYLSLEPDEIKLKFYATNLNDEDFNFFKLLEDKSCACMHSTYLNNGQNIAFVVSLIPSQYVMWGDDIS